MNAAEYDLLRNVEDHHWWHRLLRGQVVKVIEEKMKGRGRLLDAGCGTGGMLRHLQKHTSGLELSGLDHSPHAVRHCHERGVPALEASMHNMPFRTGFFDMVLSLDVLYHQAVEEPLALAEINRVLKDGGWLVVNMPAFDCLRGSHDDAVQGARRYRAGKVQSMLARHGFEVVHSHYWNAWAFLPMLVWRQISRHLPGLRHNMKSDLAVQPGLLAPLLGVIGRIDMQVCRSLRMPFGSSLFVAARKPGTPSPGWPP